MPVIYTLHSSPPDSSQFDSSHSGTLGKDRGHKGRKKWSGILSGKHKHANRHDDESAEGMRGVHESLVKHPLPTSIPKEQMVRHFSITTC